MCFFSFVLLPCRHTCMSSTVLPSPGHSPAAHACEAYDLLRGMGPSVSAVVMCQHPCLSSTACLLLSCPRQVTPEQRSHAKRLAYGLLYGMGPSALAADLGVSMGQAVQLADDFRRSHPGLDAWIKVGLAAACCGVDSSCDACMLYGC
jgi:hypothetical protein